LSGGEQQGRNASQIWRLSTIIHPGHEIKMPDIGAISFGMLRLRTSSGDNVFKSAEEREAERREREAAQAREQAARAEQARIAEEQRKRDAFRATPIGAATLAMEEGQPFFEVQLRVGGHTGTAGFGSIEGRHTTSSSAAILAEIEKLGWRLEHTGYYFMVTGETSTNRVFLSGEATAISGVTIGVYLFRNTALSDSPT
jgi:hypothetical protein